MNRYPIHATPNPKGRKVPSSRVPRGPVRRPSSLDRVSCATGCHSYPIDNPNMKPKQPYRSYSNVLASPAPPSSPMRPHYPSRPRFAYDCRVHPNSTRYPGPCSHHAMKRHNRQSNPMISSQSGTGRTTTSVPKPSPQQAHPYMSKKGNKVSWKKIYGTRSCQEAREKLAQVRDHSGSRITRVDTVKGPVDIHEDFPLDFSQIEKVLNLVALHAHCDVLGNKCQVNTSSSCGTKDQAKRLDKLLKEVSSGKSLLSEDKFVKEQGQVLKSFKKSESSPRPTSPVPEASEQSDIPPAMVGPDPYTTPRKEQLRIMREILNDPTYGQSSSDSNSSESDKAESSTMVAPGLRISVINIPREIQESRRERREKAEKENLDPDNKDEPSSSKPVEPCAEPCVEPCCKPVDPEPAVSTKPLTTILNKASTPEEIKEAGQLYRILTTEPEIPDDCSSDSSECSTFSHGEMPGKFFQELLNRIKIVGYGTRF